jgi:SNF family Na+-dependent transporter
MGKERWSSKIGVILAVAGSAIGIGNFLRFPAQAANNGGGAFMIPYFTALLLVGLPLMWIEWTIGRFGGGFGHSTAPGIFHTLWNKNKFIKYFGVIGIFGPIIIFIYYIYIESWLLGYSVFAIMGKYAACTTQQSMLSFLHSYQGMNNEYFGGIGTAYFFFVITFLLNIGVIYLGVSKGIEKVCEYGLPVLFVFAIILLIRVFMLGTPDAAAPDNNVINGLGFMWNPDWSALGNAKVWVAATGQIFYTLSVGIGVILTYASYLTKDDDVALSGLGAAATNELAEVILGGSIVITAAFVFFGANTKAVAASGTFNLGFVTMPLILQKVAFGNVFGFMWFMLLFLAGVTSSISLAQPAVAFLEDEFNFTKRRASGIFGIVTFILCQPVIFFLGRGVLDELDFWSVNVCLIVFATVEAILFGWIFGMEKAWTQLHTGSDIKIPKIYQFIIKFITPLFLLLLMGFWAWQEWGTVILMKNVSAENKPYIFATRIGLLIFFGLLTYLVRHSWHKRKQKEADRHEN